MATLKDLCSNVPQSLLNAQTDYNVMQRKVASYEKRMQQLDTEKCIFEQCKRNRTQKRVHNAFSRDEAGRCGDTIVVKRFTNSRLTCVCKSKSNVIESDASILTSRHNASVLRAKLGK